MSLVETEVLWIDAEVAGPAVGRRRCCCMAGLTRLWGGSGSLRRCMRPDGGPLPHVFAVRAESASSQSCGPAPGVTSSWVGSQRGEANMSWRMLRIVAVSAPAFTAVALLASMTAPAGVATPTLRRAIC